MYLKKTRQKSGRIYLSIVDGYYDKEKGHSRTITIEKVGYLDELEKQYEDPIAFFKERVELLKEQKAERKAPVSIEFTHDETLETNPSYRKNLGYAVLSTIYHELGIDKFLANRQRGSKIGFSSNDIMKLLVFSRLLHPASKKKTFERKPLKVRIVFSKKTTTLWMMSTAVYHSLISIVHRYRYGLTIESNSAMGVAPVWFTMTLLTITLKRIPLMI